MRESCHGSATSCGDGNPAQRTRELRQIRVQSDALDAAHAEGQQLNLSLSVTNSRWTAPRLL
jgi:hypothetical protein